MPSIFVIAPISALIISFLLLIRFVMAQTALRRDARDEYRARTADRAHTIKDVSEAEFVRIYVAAHAPRWTLYASLTLIGAVLVTPVAAFVLMWLWDLAYQAANNDPVFAVGYYPWMFYMFFGLIASWALCGFAAARFHHARAPEPFQAALMRARGEPLDNVVIKKARPKWAKRVDELKQKGGE